jgi:ABC-type taurine transport system substrate-binding protein
VKKSEADKIKTVADLKGKRIGVSSPGSATHNFVAALLERAGVPWHEASFVSIGTGLSAVAAMRSGGELDAIVNLDPAINALIDGGDAVALVDPRTDNGTVAAYLADCLYVKTEFLKANPNTSQALANAIVHAMQWLKTASIDEIIKSLPPECCELGETSGQTINRVVRPRNGAVTSWILYFESIAHRKFLARLHGMNKRLTVSERERTAFVQGKLGVY